MWNIRRMNQRLKQFNIQRFKHKMRVWIWNAWNFTFEVETRKLKVESRYELWKRFVISKLDGWDMNFTYFFAISHPKSWHGKMIELLRFKVDIKHERYKIIIEIEKHQGKWRGKNPKQNWELKCMNNIAAWKFQNKDWVGRWKTFETCSKRRNTWT